MPVRYIVLTYKVFYFASSNKRSTTLAVYIPISYECSEFIFCSDAGLGSKQTRFLNSFGNRGYVITQSLKKMKKEDQDTALSPTQFKKIGSDRFVDISTIDESDETVFNTVFYKEIPVVTGSMDETIIVTYPLPMHQDLQHCKCFLQEFSYF